MIDSLRSHPWRWATGTVAALGVLAWVAFGYFGVHTLFVDDVVAEATPTFDAPAPSATSVPDSADDRPSVAPTTSPTTAPSQAATPTAPSEPAAVPTTTVPATAPPTTTAAPAIVTELTGTFVGEAHPTVGDALVLGNGTGQRFLRFENFETDNGPDLNVYLVNSSTGDVSDYIDLGDLKGNIGEQNYEIPEGVDLSVYDTVAIWCVRFSVGFGSAELIPA